ncbi:hypothetical protein M8PIadj_0247 [Bifidobacterium animalis]|uniref:Uncharacterized protein n=1 Tax=Bifidobacterium animalis subsp. lactis CNCM I-2494 TaxID=1042403 RepID=A0A806FHS7_BIFAN|nr:hypothetical protein BALAC2494_01991 [Bifidobacterium animalis subsp. lactis CNCM I-2494]AJD33354.1 hypothetical protein BAA6_0241 [Bifidobacterium animalis]QIR80273.1 hypothetical protein M8PIadj_0247 [Bifidobacterium animalis]
MRYGVNNRRYGVNKAKVAVGRTTDIPRNLRLVTLTMFTP